MDQGQGVIKNLKAHLVLRVIEDIKKQAESKITVLDAIIMLYKTWYYVISTEITNCFRHVDFYNVLIDTTQ